MLGLVKVVPPFSYPFGEPQMQAIKWSSRGLIGADRDDLVKRAGEDILRDVDRWNILPGEVPVHLFALGSTEKFGSNRNGDGFRDKTCEFYHDTFVKHARWYREHLNTDPAKSYGAVKCSMFRAPMGRVELIVGLNSNKEAAERNGGKIADEELEKLARGDDVAVSMATPVPYDVCSFCGNKARTRHEYCRGIDEGGTCKAGGLRNKIGSVVELDDGTLHQLHADNPIVRWKDISHVFRPADRIGYVTSTLKMASVGRVRGGAELAEALGVSFPLETLLPPPELATEDVSRQFKVACRLAELETAFASGMQPPPYLQAACDRSALDGISGPPEDFQKKAGAWLRAMVDQRIVMPLPMFISTMGDVPLEKAAMLAEIVAPHLSTVFNDLANSNDFHQQLRENRYTPASHAEPRMQTWALRHEQDWGTKSASVQRRARLATIRGYASRLDFTEKSAAADDPAKETALQYALYKIAYLAALPERESEDQLTLSLISIQNVVR